MPHADVAEGIVDSLLMENPVRGDQIFDQLRIGRACPDLRRGACPELGRGACPDGDPGGEYESGDGGKVFSAH